MSAVTITNECQVWSLFLLSLSLSRDAVQIAMVEAELIPPHGCKPISLLNGVALGGSSGVKLGSIWPLSLLLVVDGLLCQQQ